MRRAARRHRHAWTAGYASCIARQRGRACRASGAVSGAIGARRRCRRRRANRRRRRGIDGSRRLGSLEVEAFVEPTGDAADHQLHRAAEFCEPDRAARRAIAVRPRAIRHEQRVERIRFELRRDDLAVRQVDRARHVTLRVERGAAYVEQYEIGLAAAIGERRMHVPAIGFERQRGAEMRQRVRARGGGNLADERGRLRRKLRLNGHGCAPYSSVDVRHCRVRSDFADSGAIVIFR
ncbi:hypothetical protein PT2222_260070 [Paraburkholderia tropica]